MRTSQWQCLRTAWALELALGSWRPALQQLQSSRKPIVRIAQFARPGLELWESAPMPEAGRRLPSVW